MKKLALLILLFVLAGASAQAQNIVKSLERNVPGQGKVTGLLMPEETLLLTGMRLRNREKNRVYMII